MRVRSFLLEFKDGRPVDPMLYHLARSYCDNNLAEEVDLQTPQKVFVAATVDKDGDPFSVTGVSGLATILDIPLWRASDKRSHLALMERMNNYLADRGYRGCGVTLFLTPDLSKRCENWQEVLDSVKAEPANRYFVTVK